MAQAVADPRGELDRGWELMAVVNAATAGLTSVIAEVLDDGGELNGFRSPEQFVAWRFGVSTRRARGLVAIARRRSELPVTMAAFDDGRITEDQAAVIAKLVPQARDGEVCDLALVCTMSQLERICRCIPQPDAETPEREREVRHSFDDDGSWRLTAALPADEGALVEAALAAARGEVFRDRHPDAPDGAQPRDVSWADALVRLSERGLEALDPATRAGRHPSERYAVLVHVQLDDTGAPDVARLHAGPLLPDQIRRYLMCDARFRAVVEANGKALGVTIPAPVVDQRQRVLVEQRDGGCVVPGCTQTRWLHIHHLIHREDGGPTAVANLVCLCGPHHRLHHQGGFRIDGDPHAGLTFTRRNGSTMHPPPNPGVRGHVPPAAAESLGLTWGPYQGTACEPIDWRYFYWN